MKAWQRLSRRDQNALLLVALALGLYLLWFGLMAPLVQHVSDQRSQLQRQQQTLLDVRQLSAALRADRAGAGPSLKATDLPRLLDQTLRQNGLRMGGYQPSAGGEVSLRLDDVDFDALLQWLHALEFEHAVVVREVSVSARAEAGKVSAQLRLKGSAE